MHMMKKIVMVMLLPTTLVANAYAGTVSDSLRTTLYYRSGYSLLELSYMDNAAKLETPQAGYQKHRGQPQHGAAAYQDPFSAASPEGNTKLNKRLAGRKERRTPARLSQGNAESARQRLHGLLRGRRLGRTRPEDTERKCAVEPESPLHHSEHPEWIVRNGKVVDGRKRQLQNLDGGTAWKYMLANHFDSLRSGALVVCEIRHIVPSVSPTDTLTLIQNQQGSEQDSLQQKDARDTASQLQVYPGGNAAETENAAHASGRNSYYALKTNLLYDALLVPNLGIRDRHRQGWTLGASGMLAWWSKDASHKYWRIYGGEMEIRKYFGRKAKEKPMLGHHISLYGQFLTYDIENGGTGHQSKKTYGAGMEYGYSLPIGRRLNLDFGLGVGYIKSHYKTYEPKDGCYVYEATSNRTWIGPTRGEVSLVWLLGNGNTNSKKGGKK